MKTTRSLPSVMALASLALPLATTQAQTPSAAAKPAAPPPPTEWDKFVKETKNPTEWLSWGGDLRIRDEYYDNIVSLANSDNTDTAAREGHRHEQNVLRIRSRLWTSITPVTNLSVNARLASEVREWTKPSFTGNFAGQQGMEWRYGIVDNLNVKWNNIADQPLSATVGRQDIAIGDFYNWWLVADGTPNDGSWTFFLDSARVNFEAKEIKTKFDISYVHQNALPDEWIPTLDQPSNGRDILPGGRTDYYLTEQNEQGVIAYVSNKLLKDTSLDGFFIYKRDDRESFLRNGSVVTPGDDANIYTLGGRVHGLYDERWQYSLEGAYQFGEKSDQLTDDAGARRMWRDLSAFGANARLTYLLKDKFDTQIQLQYEFLSGDDKSTTGEDEMFDILWGRWPRWSELYIYSYAAETSGKFAQMNNVQRFGPAVTMKPLKGLTLGATYNALFAPEETPTRATNPALFSRDGNFRGHLFQGVAKYQFNKHLSAHLWAEFVWQGDYYTSRDRTTFLRPEVMLTF